MKKDSIRKSAVRSLILGAALILAATLAQARQPGEQPIGWSKVRAANSPIRPIYASEIDRSTRAPKTTADQAAGAVKPARVSPELDSVEKAWPGSISLERHQADLAAVRDQFNRCMASMKQQLQAKIDNGTATAEDKAQFKQCMAHCQAALATISDIHLNSSSMTTATRKVYFLNGMEQHQKLMSRLQEQLKSCPMPMNGMTAALSVPGNAAKDQDVPQMGDRKDAARDKK